MGKFLLTILFIVLVIAGGVYYFYSKTGIKKDTIYVGSQAFLNSDPIPKRYTCDGDDVSPPISIDRVPGDAKSLVLIVDDADTGDPPFTHWIVFNIDPGRTDVVENKIPDALEGTNDFGELKYKGPCPTTGEHRYYFRIFALDTTLSLEEGAKRADVQEAMKGHILAQGSFFGTYSR